LEGYELSYLRAIDVIILSAVLKRRMLLADKAKSLFISKSVEPNGDLYRSLADYTSCSISHELRTPLHGVRNYLGIFFLSPLIVLLFSQILAAAELLHETRPNHSQIPFLQTIQACGTSLVETVNHVLDFTKLSGNTKSGGVENPITPSKSVSQRRGSFFASATVFSTGSI
jgi:signal transduction histidine kinase